MGERFGKTQRTALQLLHLVPSIVHKINLDETIFYKEDFQNESDRDRNLAMTKHVEKRGHR